jgi:N-acetylneuraminic acid mutarotase
VTLTITDTDTGETDAEVKVGYINTLVADWSEISTSQAPPVIGEYAMAYDGTRDVLLLYGGNATGWPYEDITWEFDGTDWETITTTQSPPAVYGASMVYDSNREKIVLFGGSTNADVPLSQTWEYSGTDWVQVVLTTTPSARTNSAMVYDPANGETYLFGGLNGGAYYSDTWVYDGSSWSQVTVSGQSPSARALHAMGYDPTNGTILLFGGRSATGSPLNDLWRFDPDTATWTEITDTGPSARFGHSLAYFSNIGAFVLVGGTEDAGDTILDDTWLYLPATGWIDANPATVPPAVVYHVVVYHGGREAIMLVTAGETWEYK